MAQCYLTTDNSCLGIGKLAVLVWQKKPLPSPKNNIWVTLHWSRYHQIYLAGDSAKFIRRHSDASCEQFQYPRSNFVNHQQVMEDLRQQLTSIWRHHRGQVDGWQHRHQHRRRWWRRHRRWRRQRRRRLTALDDVHSAKRSSALADATSEPFQKQMNFWDELRTS